MIKLSTHGDNQMIEIAAFSRDYVQNALGIKQATLYRYLWHLKQALGDDFPYEFGSKSIPTECFEILRIFREMVKKFSFRYATKNIKKELLENGYIIQENHQQPTGKSTEFTIKFPR
jgi:hypothetical protein